jgi:hypothetical protein
MLITSCSFNCGTISSQMLEKDNHRQSHRSKSFRNIISRQTVHDFDIMRMKGHRLQLRRTTGTSTCQTFSEIRFNVPSSRGSFSRQSHLDHPTKKSCFTDLPDTSTLTHDDHIKSLRTQVHPSASGEAGFDQEGRHDSRTSKRIPNPNKKTPKTQAPGNVNRAQHTTSST